MGRPLALGDDGPAGTIVAMTDPTLAGRLAIHPGAALWFQPIEWLRLLEPLPPGVTVTGEFAGATVAVIFVSNASGVHWFLRRYGTVITLPPAVWVCAPTRARTDFNVTYLGSILAGHGLSPIEETSIDDAWTAVRIGRFVPGRPSPAGLG